MNSEELKQMINLYFDGELDKGAEPILFSLLSNDTDARDYFKKMNLLKNGIRTTIEDFPSSLDSRILNAIGKQGSKNINRNAFKNFSIPVTYSIAALLLIVALFFYSKSEEYKVQLADLSREVQQQNENIVSIMNILPEVEVKGLYIRMKMINVNGYSNVIRPILITLPEVQVNENYIKLKEIIVTSKI